MLIHLKDTKADINLGYICTNHSMTIDEALKLVGGKIDEDGEILGHFGNRTGAYYDDLELIYDAED